MRARWRRLAGRGRPQADDAAIETEAERAIRMFGAPTPHPFPEPIRYHFQPPDRRGERERARAPFTVVLPGLLVGGLLGYALTVDDPMTVKQLPERAYEALRASTDYRSCAHARLVGAAPLYKGQPGYSKRLDTDGNGVACEPLFGETTKDRKARD